MEDIPGRGQIWQVSSEPTVGAEMAKVRPAVIVNIPEADRLPLGIVVPITDWKAPLARFFWFVRLSPSSENGLS